MGICGSKSKECGVRQTRLVGPVLLVMSCATLGNFLSLSEPFFLKRSFLKDCESKAGMRIKEHQAVCVRCGQV